ncbi:unnamed protein product [Dibothriocephalus latus]|uniref:Uncharacterized protein n=1 Tax=Dibothriocephalus latus TaxID=60516 RepID=A0A3P7Q6Y4_DIBLA|nr:unnamed protein product [Dibothriocephalus latus]
MKRIIAATPTVTAAPDMLKLLQLWYDHCLSALAGLSLSAQLPKSDQGLTDLSAALGMMLLLESEQDGLETLASPPMKKLAASCLAAHLPPAQNSTALNRELLPLCVLPSTTKAEKVIFER